MKRKREMQRAALVDGSKQSAEVFCSMQEWQQLRWEIRKYKLKKAKCKSPNPYTQRGPCTTQGT
jgi:hypothetical protein